MIDGVPNVDHPTYPAWNAMKARCNWKTSKSYKYYGARGIKVCERWSKRTEGFPNFIKDMGEKPGPQYSLDRIDNDGDYSPENCRWANRQVQNMNKQLVAKNGSGVLGVLEPKGRHNWVVKINLGNQGPIHLGSYITKEEAVAARIAAEKVKDASIREIRVKLVQELEAIAPDMRTHPEYKGYVETNITGKWQPLSKRIQQLLKEIGS